MVVGRSPTPSISTGERLDPLGGGRRAMLSDSGATLGGACATSGSGALCAAAASSWARNQARTTAAMTEFGVHVVGKIQRGCAARQVDDLATRRQRIDPIGKQLAANPIEEVAFTALARCQQFPRPLDLALVAQIAG